MSSNTHIDGQVSVSHLASVQALLQYPKMTNKN